MAPLLVSTAQTLEVVEPQVVLESTMSMAQLLVVFKGSTGLVFVPINTGLGIPSGVKLVERVIPGGRLVEVKTVFSVLTVPN